jgi:hypothetical protein
MVLQATSRDAWQSAVLRVLNVPDHRRLAAITVALIIVISTGNPEFPSPTAHCASLSR